MLCCGEQSEGLKKEWKAIFPLPLHRISDGSWFFSNHATYKAGVKSKQSKDLWQVGKGEIGFGLCIFSCDFHLLQPAHCPCPPAQTLPVLTHKKLPQQLICPGTVCTSTAPAGHFMAAGCRPIVKVGDGVGPPDNVLQMLSIHPNKVQMLPLEFTPRQENDCYSFQPRLAATLLGR